MDLIEPSRQETVRFPASKFLLVVILFLDSVWGGGVLDISLGTLLSRKAKSRKDFHLLCEGQGVEGALRSLAASCDFVTGSKVKLKVWMNKLKLNPELLNPRFVVCGLW